MKICSKCKQQKNVNEFYKKSSTKSGITSQCKVCINLYNKEYADKNREFVLQAKRNWKTKNRRYCNQYCKNRKQSDIQYRLSCNLRTRLCQAIANDQKCGSAVRDLGCTVKELKLHLEQRFKPEMTWSNYGTMWHIDHTKPLCSFNLSDRKQLLEACHYSNLQPLWAEENYAKIASDLKTR